MSQAIESILTETRVFPPPAAFAQAAAVSGLAAYRALYREAERDPDQFWARHARENLHWDQPFTQVLDDSNAPFYRWFGDGELNVSYNCLDVHLANGNADKTAIIFEADDGQVTRISYRDLHARVCRVANGIKALGFKTGERAILYMPMSIEAVVAMQACARLGITHSVVFAGFSAKSLHERIVDVGATLVITADEQLRGGKHIALKSAVDEALNTGGCDAVRPTPCATSSSTNAAALMSIGRRGATAGCTRSKPTSPKPALRCQSTPNTRSSFSTPPAPPANPRACSTPRRAICCGRC